LKPFLFIFLMVFFSQLTNAQAGNRYTQGIGIQIKGFVAPKAKITVSEGNDRLMSRLQSTFTIGINKHIQPDNTWNISTGLHLELSNWNFYFHDPDGDLAPLIENKDVDFTVTLPVVVIRNFRFNDVSFFNVQGGLKLSYNGFTSGQTISTYQSTQIFTGEFTNQKNPWVSLLAGAGKTFYLKNYDLLSIDLVYELSSASNVRGDYEISIPNRPITRGNYTTNRSRFGISVQYIFTRQRK
jgi:hypothetical protein